MMNPFPAPGDEDAPVLRLKPGRRKNVQAMTLAELRGHIARVGSRMALARGLPCSRSALYDWARGKVNIPAAWAEKIRLVPVPPPRPTRAERAEARLRERQLPLPLPENVATGAPAAEEQS